MAVCPDCGQRYGVCGANRKAIFQSCPGCGWDPQEEKKVDPCENCTHEALYRAHNIARDPCSECDEKNR